MCCAPAARASPPRRCSATCSKAPSRCWSRRISPAHDAALAAGLGAFLGHLFPVWLKFKGGKGVATYIGLLLGLSWPGALIFCAIWLVVAWPSPLFLARRAGRQRADAACACGCSARRDAAALFLLLTVLLWIMHRANIAPPARRQRRQDRREALTVMPGFMPGIHVSPKYVDAGTSPAMTCVRPVVARRALRNAGAGNGWGACVGAKASD